MHYEGPKRQGRFLKKGSKVLDQVSLMNFSFQEISDAKVVGHDNAKRTIIHSHYHEPTELSENIQAPGKFDDELLGNDQKRAIIMPTDFTAEWERTRRLRKDRISRSDDDEFDLEYEAQRLDESNEADAAGFTPDVPAATDAPPAQVKPPAPQPVAQQPLPQPTASQQPPAKGGSVGGMVTGTEKQWESMDAVGQAIKSLNFTAAEPPSQPPQRPQAPGSDQFIPVAQEGAAEDTVRNPEADAARAYRQRVEVEQQNKQILDELSNEAKAQGYHDGFRTGEEKAEVQVRQNAAQVFGKVNELIREFAGLKHEILNNVQQNFYELCQAMSEALIKREFSINPETFVTVLRRAINEAVEPGKFRVRVHPEMYDRLASLPPAEIQELKEALVRDAEIAKGDFKIESDLSVVDASISKMIADLLAQADLKLFDDEEKAS